MDKKLDNQKICFIICYNQDVYLEECLVYLQNLHVPDGFSTDLLTISDATSITQGYQMAMEESDAKYKIYMHQDVFILYPYFLDSLIQIFQLYSRIGMIGMVGTPSFSPDYIMWSSQLVGSHYKDYYYNGKGVTTCDYRSYRYELNHGLSMMDVIDGFLMATAYDIPWRTDLLDGWHFYDVSQSFEFRRRGLKIAVPGQNYPWCLHDDGVAASLWDYNKYRKICMEEYPLSLLPPGSH